MRKKNSVYIVFLIFLLVFVLLIKFGNPAVMYNELFAGRPITDLLTTLFSIITGAVLFCMFFYLWTD